MTDEEARYRRLAAEVSALATCAAQSITADTVRSANASRRHLPSSRVAIVLFVAAAITAAVLAGTTRNGVAPGPAGVTPTLAWTKLRPHHSPPALDSAASTYDGATHQVLLFGGEEIGGAGQNATWQWTGSTWKQLHPPTSPPLLIGASMAYDPATRLVVLFGGLGDYAIAPAQTWAWTGTTWERLHPSSSPSARAYAAMAFDEATGQLLLFGGYDSRRAPLADTWDWTGYTWERLASAGPGARSGAGIVYDPLTRQLLLFGGGSSPASPSPTSVTTWSWSGTAWDALTPADSPPARSGESLAYDPLVGQVVLFGGGGESRVASQGLAANVLNDTWKWTGTTWEKVDAARLPPGRVTAAMTVDPVTRQLILFGGADKNLAPLGDTWCIAAP
jgi:hypothetical protein